MTREEAIKEFESELKWAELNIYPYVSKQKIEADNMAIKALEQEPKTGQWIPVSERLPKAGEYTCDVAKYYLVQNEYGDMLVARYTHSQYWEQMYQLKPYADKIVAWRPLPAPYKAESEDKE